MALGRYLNQLAGVSEDVSLTRETVLRAYARITEIEAPLVCNTFFVFILCFLFRLLDTPFAWTIFSLLNPRSKSVS